MALSKKLQKINYISKDHQSSKSEAPKKRGRPIKKPDDDQLLNPEMTTESHLENHDSQFAINYIDTSASKKMHADNEEFKTVLGKRSIDMTPFADEEAKINSEILKSSLSVVLSLKSKIESTLKAQNDLSGMTESQSHPTSFKQFTQEILQEHLYDGCFQSTEDSSFIQESEFSELSSQIDFERTPSVSYLWEEDKMLDFFDQEDESSPQKQDFVQKKLKTHRFIGEEDFGTFSSIGRSYADSSVKAISQMIHSKASNQLNFEFKIDANTTPCKIEKQFASRNTQSLDIEKIASFAQTENRIMKDVSTNNVCEMIDFGNDKPSVDGDTSDDMDFRENSFLSPSQSPKHKSSGKSLEEMFFNHMSIQTSPLYQTLVGDKYTQVDI